MRTLSEYEAAVARDRRKARVAAILAWMLVAFLAVFALAGVVAIATWLGAAVCS